MKIKSPEELKGDFGEQKGEGCNFWTNNDTGKAINNKEFNKIKQDANKITYDFYKHNHFFANPIEVLRQERLKRERLRKLRIQKRKEKLQELDHEDIR